MIRSGRHAWLGVGALSLALALPGISTASATGVVGTVAPRVEIVGGDGVVAAGFVDGPEAAGGWKAFTIGPTTVLDLPDGHVTVYGEVTATDVRDAAASAGRPDGIEPFSYFDPGDGTVVIDPDWVRRNIVTASVPVLGWVTCHRQIIGPLTGALNEIVNAGLDHLVKEYGGCWVPRRIDWSPARPLSMHAWGLAFDINTATNPLGAAPRLDARLVEVFERWGFAWGGHWHRPDGMHFELRHAPRTVDEPVG